MEYHGIFGHGTARWKGFLGGLRRATSLPALQRLCAAGGEAMASVGRVWNHINPP